MVRSLIGRDELLSEPAFQRREATRWLHPIEIGRTAFHALFSSTISSYTDRRDAIASLKPLNLTPIQNCPIQRGANGAEAQAWLEQSDDGLWIDFVADVGDGFDATFATASVLARRELSVRGLEQALPRADILVLGGDLVYPYPSRDGYRNRLVGPLRAALPEFAGSGGDGGAAQRERVPSIFAIPGNHDWYDGLTNFLRRFCQGRAIGGWQTWQSRSYFAVRLSRSWWLWGIDIQFENRIDQGQLAYFENLADFGEGHRVILCTAKPSWYEAQRHSKGYQNLDFFIGRTIRARGARVEVALSGDVHHYARFANQNGTQLITAGGGGAYLRGTHNLPRVLTLRQRRSIERTEDDVRDAGGGSHSVEYVEGGFPYPNRTDSRRLAAHAISLPLRSANSEFCLTVGLLYAFWFWLLDPTNLQSNGIRGYLTLIGRQLLERPYHDLLMPVLVVVCGIALAVGANRDASRILVGSWGAFHGVAHLGLALSVGWAALQINARIDPQQTLPLFLFLFVFSFVPVVGGWLGGLLVGAYLMISDRLFGWHENEAFLCQNIRDYRSFIRMHLRKDGSLTIYPLGLRRVPRRWRYRDRSEDDDPEADPAIYEPADGSVLQPHVIESPVPLVADLLVPDQQPPGKP